MKEKEISVELEMAASINAKIDELSKRLGKSREQLIIKLLNCRLIKGSKLVSNNYLWIQNGRVIDGETLFFTHQLCPDLEINCGGLVLASGFVELQLNGAFGYDFTNESDVDKCLDTVNVGLLQYGVTAYCPTLISSTPTIYAAQLPKYEAYIEKDAREPKGARVLGLHLEGPFINVEKKGAHDRDVLQKFSDHLSVSNVYGGMSVERLSKFVRIVTLAPELDPEGKIITALDQSGITVSIGHSLADLAQGEAAVRQGARFITHLFNAMQPFHHRDPHLIGLLAEVHSTRPYYGIIADGIHTHPSALNIAFKSHPEGLVLVTDAISPLGLEEKSVCELGTRHVEIQRDAKSGKKRAYLKDTNTLAGSVATMDECVRNLLSSTNCTLVEALKCASQHPARLTGRFPELGSLEPDSYADFVLLDDSESAEGLAVKATFVQGFLRWIKDDFKLEMSS
jgi:N-acetylglucosamine-6-phosphate deacetylase